MIQVFEIKPEYDVKDYDHGSIPKTYTFIVRTRDKPGIEDKEKIKQDIERAWEELFDVSGSPWERVYYWLNVIPPPLGISVIGPSSEEFSPSAEIPEFAPGVFYLVFAHMKIEGEVSKDDYITNQAELREAFERPYLGLSNPPRIALVPIYNCSIELVTGLGERTVPPKRNRVNDILRRHGLR